MWPGHRTVNQTVPGPCHCTVPVHDSQTGRIRVSITLTEFPVTAMPADLFSELGSPIVCHN